MLRTGHQRRRRRGTKGKDRLGSRRHDFQNTRSRPQGTLILSCSTPALHGKPEVLTEEETDPQSLGTFPAKLVSNEQRTQDTN